MQNFVLYMFFCGVLANLYIIFKYTYNVIFYLKNK